MPIAALEDRESVSAAWLQAVAYLKKQPGKKCYNLAYVVTRPEALTLEDKAVIALFDAFARSAGRHPVTTIANTIFPSACYRVGGASRVYEDYEREIYPRVKTQWGNYVDRMIRRRDIKGRPLLDRQNRVINPLKALVDKLKQRASSRRGTTTHYELPVSDEAFEISTYDPVRDARYQRGGPCLSHLSFKVDQNGAVRLTAFYRSHFYLERALGNLVGLARLLGFVGKEAGCATGPLTVIASEACLEGSLGTAKAADVKAFLAGLGV